MRINGERVGNRPAPFWIRVGAAALVPGAVLVFVGVVLWTNPLGDASASPISVVLETALEALLATSLLAAGLAADRGLPVLGGRVLQLPLLRWLGTLSFGIFLWHYPILEALSYRGYSSWAVLLIGLPSTVAIAALSWYALERPVQDWSRLFLPPRLPPVARRGRCRPILGSPISGTSAAVPGQASRSG
jgi:peptidoglycan/LPS O-acetylase OafA/YrhL